MRMNSNDWHVTFVKQMSVLALLSTIGCAQQPPINAIDARAIGDVQAEIKHQVGVYMNAAKNYQPSIVVKKNGQDQVVLLSNDPAAFWCGRGNIGYNISNVKAELTTALDTTTEGKIGLKIPVHLVTIGPSVDC
jgi:hypothetical protein